MIPLLYAGVVLGQTTQASFMKLNSRNGTSDVVRFNFFKSLAALCLFLVLFVAAGESFHLPTMLYGMLFGVCISCSSYFAYRALGLGPLSLTYMLFNCCILVSCLYGVIFFDERITALGGVGLALMLGAMVLLNFDFSAKKKGMDTPAQRKPRISPKWALFIGLCLFGDGFCQVSQSAHQKGFPGEHQIGFMLWAMLTWCVIYLIAALPAGQLKAGRVKLRSDLYAAGSGLSNSLANFFILKLAAMSSAVLLFPTVSVVCILGALLSGLIFFREKLNLQQCFGFVLGVGAIFLLQL